MKLPTPLIKGRLLKRYKRFLADIELDDGREITAHCANPGSMLGIAIEGAPIWVHEHKNTKRKLPFSWELIQLDKTLVPINTTNPNKIVLEAIEADLVPELASYGTIRREVKYGENSRVDLLLEGGRRRKPCFVEVKNVHLSRRPGLAEFPDSVTARGAKHLGELIAQRENGARAVMFFLVQRTDCDRFSPADDLDPAYGQALREARRAGVETMCYDCDISMTDVTLRHPLDLVLNT